MGNAIKIELDAACRRLEELNRQPDDGSRSIKAEVNFLRARVAQLEKELSEAEKKRPELSPAEKQRRIAIRVALNETKKERKRRHS